MKTNKKWFWTLRREENIARRNEELRSMILNKDSDLENAQNIIR